MEKTFFTLFCMVMFNQSFAQHAIIPAPVSFESSQTAFELGPQLQLYLESDDSKVRSHVNLFVDFLSTSGVEVKWEQSKAPRDANKAVVVSLNRKSDAVLGEEGYTLDVSSGQIKLAANEPAGIFNGLQTLRQMLPVEFESPEYQLTVPIKIPGCTITDYPRFGWRGLMLDVSRHFFPVKDVKAYIDQMSRYKLNVFHWHLTDDEGWRIEIKSLPKLTEVGAWRVERYGRFGEDRPYPQPGEEATYGGFYTQEQIKDIVQYAQDRNITIVPEIDMPGHSMAALAAYPELSTTKEEKFVNPGSKFAEWYGDGEFRMLIENTLNPTDEKVYEFIDKVMTEVAALFPGEYIHMGGDEAYHGYWEEDPDIQEFMRKNDIENTHQLQSYFVKRVEQIISSKGKKMIGWDEILEGGLAEGAAVMSWRGMSGGIEAAKMGHEVVMSPTTYAYLDYTQGDHSVENSIYADLSLEKTYSFEPMPEGVDPRYILGGQGNLWTEVIPTIQYAFYMTYPRALALAETFWSPREKKDWESFIKRTEQHFARFDASGTNISKAVYEPIIMLHKGPHKMVCDLKTNVPNTEIYYSIDNTYPVIFGQKYEGPFEIPDGDLSLRAQTYRDGQPLGRELIIHRSELEQRSGH